MKRGIIRLPYYFWISRDDLPSYCQGGRGRDDGKTTANNTMREAATT